MRIISGSARGRRLADFSGKEIRPTPDRLREALFSLLFSRLEGFAALRVLELYAGSGAMSLEAISRGAASAVLVDSNPASIDLIRENVRRCGFEAQVTVQRRDVTSALPALVTKAPFDLVFMDPPYGRGLLTSTLETIERLNLLSDDGIICAESETDFIPASSGRLECYESRRYGNSSVHLYRKRTLTEDPI